MIKNTHAFLQTTPLNFEPAIEHNFGVPSFKNIAIFVTKHRSAGADFLYFFSLRCFFRPPLRVFCNIGCHFFGCPRVRKIVGSSSGIFRERVFLLPRLVFPLRRRMRQSLSDSKAEKQGTRKRQTKQQATKPGNTQTNLHKTKQQPNPQTQTSNQTILHQHRPQTATNHVSTTFMRNKEHFRRPVPEKETTEKKGDKVRNPSPEPEGTKK